MVAGKPFEVSREVYERARANTFEPEKHNAYYMAEEDEKKLFSASILCGYGLYDCKVHEKDGKYICTWMRGSSCD